MDSLGFSKSREPNLKMIFYIPFLSLSSSFILNETMEEQFLFILWLFYIFVVMWTCHMWAHSLKNQQGTCGLIIVYNVFIATS